MYSTKLALIADGGAPMEFGGHVIILSLVVARSIAIKSITTLKIKRKNHVIVYQETAIYMDY